MEGEFDDRLKTVLSQATTDISEAFGDLRDDLFSAKVRKAQIVQSHRTIRGIINGLFGTEHDLIREHQQDAAVAAVDAQLYESRGILARLFKKPDELQSYSRSLEASAARNIDAVMTRVLETEKPLSARVYNTRALAQGQVAREINKVLATGGSAKDLAKNVTALIDPNTPGGVSYAARRLGTTELNNAFHAQSIHDAQAIPWVEAMKWNLSKIHESDPGDECEDYAQIGLFATDSVPEKPHPHCRCFVTPEQPPREQWEQAVDSGQYDSYLDSWLEGETPSDPAPLPVIDKAFARGETGGRIKGFEVQRPFDDELHAATSHSQVAEIIQKRYPKITVNHLDRLPLSAAKEIADSIEDNVFYTKKSRLKVIDIGDIPQAKKAEGVTTKLANGDIVMTLNVNMIRDPEVYAGTVLKNKKSGHNRSWDETRPYYSLFTHEYGHVLDFTSDMKSQPRVVDRMLQFYSATIEPEVSGKGNDAWLDRAKSWLIDNGPSTYGWIDTPVGKAINPKEMLAEGYLDYFLNQDDAHEVSKYISGLLTKTFSDHVGE